MFKIDRNAVANDRLDLPYPPIGFSRQTNNGTNVETENHMNDLIATTRETPLTDLVPDAGLVAVISSRICHDLISPIGAIVNGVDLIREIGVGDVSDELGMISQSADRASSLLQFYRVAFGNADPEATPIARATLYDQANRLIATQRVVLDWPGLQGPAIGRAEARLLYQMLLCSKLIVAMRGVIQVSLGTDLTTPIEIELKGSDGGPMNSDLVRYFDSDPSEEIPPRLVEFPLARLSAKALGLDFLVQNRGTDLVLVARPKG